MLTLIVSLMLLADGADWLLVYQDGGGMVSAKPFATLAECERELATLDNELGHWSCLARSYDDEDKP